MATDSQFQPLPGIINTEPVYSIMPYPSTEETVAATPSVEETTGTPDFGNQVGENTLTDEMFIAQAESVKSDYALSLADINSRFEMLATQIEGTQAGIMLQLEKNEALNVASYDSMMLDFRNSIGDIRAVQQLQVQQTASQLDSMMASGQFGGNVYRSQQVYSQNMTNIITQSMGLVAEVTLQYRQAAEAQRLNFSHQQLSSYITGVTSILAANADMAKSYAMIRSDMTASKNSQLNQIFQLKIDRDIAEQDRISRELISDRQIEAQKLMTQWQIDGQLKMTEMNNLIERERINAQIGMASRNNELTLQVETMRIESSERMTEWNNDLQLQLQQGKISSAQYIASMQNATQYELGMKNYEQQAAQYQQDLAIDIKQYEQGLDRLFPDAQARMDKTIASYNPELVQTNNESQTSVNVAAQQIEQESGVDSGVDWGGYGLPETGSTQILVNGEWVSQTNSLSIEEIA